jgi:glycogen(starch) synthase
LVRADLDRPNLHHLTLHRSVPDLADRLAAADILLHPARVDAFPLVCVHAAAAGTPVVAFTDAGGLGEMLGDDLVGAPYPDVVGLVTALERLLDPEVRRAVGEAHRRRAQPFLGSQRIPALCGAVRLLLEAA